MVTSFRLLFSMVTSFRLLFSATYKLTLQYTGILCIHLSVLPLAVRIPSRNEWMTGGMAGWVDGRSVLSHSSIKIIITIITTTTITEALVLVEMIYGNRNKVIIVPVYLSVLVLSESDGVGEEVCNSSAVVV